MKLGNPVNLHLIKTKPYGLTVTQPDGTFIDVETYYEVFVPRHLHGVDNAKQLIIQGYFNGEDKSQEAAISLIQRTYPGVQIVSIGQGSFQVNTSDGQPCSLDYIAYVAKQLCV
jgi:hypothetical protein